MEPSKLNCHLKPLECRNALCNAHAIKDGLGHTEYPGLTKIQDSDVQCF